MSLWGKTTAAINTGYGKIYDPWNQVLRNRITPPFAIDGGSLLTSLRNDHSSKKIIAGSGESMAYNNASLKGGRKVYNNAALKGGRKVYNNAALKGGRKVYNNAALKGGKRTYTKAALKGLGILDVLKDVSSNLGSTLTNTMSTSLGEVGKALTGTATDLGSSLAQSMKDLGSTALQNLGNTVKDPNKLVDLGKMVLPAVTPVIQKKMKELGKSKNTPQLNDLQTKLMKYLIWLQKNDPNKYLETMLKLKK